MTPCPLHACKHAGTTLSWSLPPAPGQPVTHSDPLGHGGESSGTAQALRACACHCPSPSESKSLSCSHGTTSLKNDSNESKHESGHQERTGNLKRLAGAARVVTRPRSARAALSLVVASVIIPGVVVITAELASVTRREQVVRA